MTSYVDSTLISDEHVLYEARVSLWYLLPHILFGLLLLPVFGVGLVLWAKAAIIYWTTELAVTNKRVIAKTGLIQRNTVEMFLSKVESVHVEQTVTGRVLDFGTVVISGTGVQNATFKAISHPLQFRKEFMTAADASAGSGLNPRDATIPVEPAAPRVEPTLESAPKPREPSAAKLTAEERLVELKRLYESGLITEDVYKEQQRKAIEI